MPGSAHFDLAEEVLEALRTRADAESVEGILQKLGEDEGALLTSTDLAVQCLLQIGSKSFSHFLNLLERYMALFKSVTSSAPRRRQALDAISTFFGTNHHFIHIAIDKLMRYRILDPIDVVRWVLGSNSHSIPFAQWDILLSTLDLMNTRVNGTKARLEAEIADNATCWLTVLVSKCLTVSQLSAGTRRTRRRPELK